MVVFEYMPISQKICEQSFSHAMSFFQVLQTNALKVLDTVLIISRQNLLTITKCV